MQKEETTCREQEKVLQILSFVDGDEETQGVMLEEKEGDRGHQRDLVVQLDALSSSRLGLDLEEDQRQCPSIPLFFEIESSFSSHVLFFSS